MNDPVRVPDRRRGGVASVPVRYVRVALLAAVAAGAPQQATAAGPTRPESMAFQCYTCHGSDGRSPGAILPLAGRDAQYIAAQLRAFKAGTLPATIMDRIAKGFSEQEIDAIARYIGVLAAVGPGRSGTSNTAGLSAARPEAGRSTTTNGGGRP